MTAVAALRRRMVAHICAMLRKGDVGRTDEMVQGLGSGGDEVVIAVSVQESKVMCSWAALG